MFRTSLVASAFAVPVLKAPYFASEVIGDERLDELGGAIFAAHEPAAVLHDRLTQELTVNDGGASLRLDLPFAERGDISLKKIGLELVVRVGGYALSGFYDANLLVLALLLAPAVFAGNRVGERITRTISQQAFARLLAVVLMAAAVNLLLR